jgi:hypothetical protein
VSGREVSKETWRFHEMEPVDSGSLNVKIVVISSCIVIRISFLGKAVQIVVHEDFLRVGPKMPG